MNKHRHRVTFCLAFLVLAGSNLSASPVNGFSDLNFWGTGSNQSALIINWNDGATSTSLAWGFNWSGSATMADMVTSLTNADTRLFARLDSATPFGTALYGLGYQTGSTPFAITGAQDTSGNSADPVHFVNGINDLDTDPDNFESPESSISASAVNPEDLYLEGWMDNGFWGSSSGGISMDLPETDDWSGNGGISATALENNGWYALIFKPGFVGDDWPSDPVSAIPEPGSVLLLITGLGMITWFRRFKR